MKPSFARDVLAYVLAGLIVQLIMKRLGSVSQADVSL